MIDTAISHYNRARAFLEDARRASNLEDVQRYLSSAVEQAVATVECLFGTGVLPDDRIRELAFNIPRYRLLKRVRIHNFHRRPVSFVPLALRPEVISFVMQGPIRLETGSEPGGAAWFAGGDNGPVYGGARGGRVVRQPGGARGNERDIVIINGKLFDEYAGVCVALDDAVQDFLSRVPQFLDELHWP
jgi:hypothetical protein